MTLLTALEKRYTRTDGALPEDSFCDQAALAAIVSLLKSNPELLPIDTTSLLRHLHPQRPDINLNQLEKLLHQNKEIVGFESFDRYTFVTGIHEAQELSAEIKVIEYCEFTTRARCRQVKQTNCSLVHFVPIVTRKTKLALGDCKYLDKCHRQDSCKYVHYQAEIQAPIEQVAVSGGVGIPCDVTTFDFNSLGKFAAIVMDPPWDIQMKLDYPTMADEAIAQLPIHNLQDNGWLFLWVATGKIVVGRRLLKQWGYNVVEDIVWIKINQLQHLMSQGRTGHWMNHSHEHCLVGKKGLAASASYEDCDVIVAEPTDNSRKPDELYHIIERMVPTGRKLEIFGRPHNLRAGWTTLGNQL